MTLWILISLISLRKRLMMRWTSFLGMNSMMLRSFLTILWTICWRSRRRLFRYSSSCSNREIIIRNLIRLLPIICSCRAINWIIIIMRRRRRIKIIKKIIIIYRTIIIIIMIKIIRNKSNNNSNRCSHSKKRIRKEKVRIIRKKI